MKPEQKPFGGVPEMIEKVAGGERFDPSIFEPPAEEILLPSKGVYYTDEYNKVIKDNKGIIKIRPMTFKEESLMTNPRIVKTGQILSSILSSTIKTPNVNVDYLLSSDRIFLFYFLRSISYGDKYTFSITCPLCGETFTTSINLSSLEIKYANENDKEPIEIFLPNVKRKVYLRFSRGIDERNENAMQGETEETTDAISDMLKLTVDIEGVPKMYWRKFYESLPAKDSFILRRTLQEKEPGINPLIKLKCPACDKVFEELLPLTVNFFRPEQY